jgi:peptidyl-prolyl cis-trans isomerase A (cyclophilin A)
VRRIDRTARPASLTGRAASPFVLLTALLALPLAGCGSAPPRVVLETPLGNITVEVYPDRAPVTAANFLHYVDEGLFTGASFYRVVRLDNQPDDEVRIEVVQGGVRRLPPEQRVPPITHETTEMTGLKHRDGTLSMARSRPGTASSEFFICIGDQPELDFGGRRNPDGQGFAAFGRVVEGIEVVRRIQALEPGGGQYLQEPVPITRVVRIGG